MIEVSATLELDKKTMRILDRFPSKFLYSMASQTLDFAFQLDKIPLSDQKSRGRLRDSSKAYGVKQHTDMDFSIGSQTDYAAYVWVMDNETTNWTTPGSGNEWYARTLKEKKDLMVANAIEEAK